MEVGAQTQSNRHLNSGLICRGSRVKGRCEARVGTKAFFTLNFEPAWHCVAVAPWSLGSLLTLFPDSDGRSRFGVHDWPKLDADKVWNRHTTWVLR